MKTITLTPFLISLLTSPLSTNAAGFATVDLSKSTGAAQFKASGFIYGWPDNGTNAATGIAGNLVRDIKFNANRAGGAQISAGGWARGGLAQYTPRFNSALSNYKTTRMYGGDFILLVHDMWGADGGNVGKFPGDNDNWTEMENFIKQVCKDLRANNMLEGLVIDLWNEPDLTMFWAKSWEQFLSYSARAYKLFKQELPTTNISGPSMAHSAGKNDKNWQAWARSMAGNKTIPDIYSWHQIGDWEREPDSTIPDLKSLQKTYGLPDRPIDINEYASKGEQNPANSVFYIGQLERWNLRGLRSNWGGGSALHDFMANLVFKKSGTYQPNGEWQLYKYYAGMTGEKVATTAATDRKFDVFATKSGNVAKIIAGTRTVKAQYEVRVSGLSSLGLEKSGKVSVKTYRFDWSGDSTQVGAPVDIGTKDMTYSNDALTILMDPATISTAYAYELSARK
ncbi:glycoside hydrolase superfamily [Clohesyomyces aquaticus]|uniref:Glycoside hydrolase superfamily n=1 Tax=Clohesyomyces aquaticus TaxID=1231657 RepID=A0A1Y1YSF5_9PLEO|nr:glycoside hydrolase superfamily [Clohesyomyces aquaticus]